MARDVYAHLSAETLGKILDNIYHEIYVTDASLNILYVGENCQRHYGLTPEEMIGRSHYEFSGTYWYPSILPLTYREKRRMCIQQMTVKGETIISTTVPVFDEAGEVKMVVSIVQEEINSLDMNVQAQPDSEYSIWVRRNAGTAVPTSDIITRSQAMKNLLDLGKKAAGSDIAVLIEGDSGTGKGMLARYIHEHSARSAYPFLTINCAAIPENLLESELFGYAPYAFTGASSKGKPGLIELADGGTLFLDELAELAAPLQAKLLNVVENNQYMQVGGKEIKQSNVRIISATNQSLASLVRENTFREDLFWRLNIIDLKIPPLTERKEDIIPLTSYYLNLYNKKYKTNKVVCARVFDVFLNYDWPGNIRQLRNIIERAFVLSARPEIQLEDLPHVMRSHVVDAPPVGEHDLNSQIEAMERAFILSMCAKYKTSRKLASALEISQSKANRLMQKHLCPEKSASMTASGEE